MHEVLGGLEVHVPFSTSEASARIQHWPPPLWAQTIKEICHFTNGFAPWSRRVGALKTMIFSSRQRCIIHLQPFSALGHHSEQSHPTSAVWVGSGHSPDSHERRKHFNVESSIGNMPHSRSPPKFNLFDLTRGKCVIGCQGGFAGIGRLKVMPGNHWGRESSKNVY